MCIIIYQPKGALIAPSAILRAYARNDDGWGIAARTPSGIEIHRAFGERAHEDLLDAYFALREHELIVHCRVGTSGVTDLRNTHPFHVAGSLYMFHNGVLDVDCSADDAMCDSYHVAAAIAAQLEHEANISEALRRSDTLASLHAIAGSASKLAFIDSEGVVIVNEHLGEWRDGCWYSNDTAERISATDYARSHASHVGTLYEHADERDERARYYDDIIPRCFRVETQEEEDALYLDTLALISDLSKLDVDEIAERVNESPEMGAEVISVLLQERRFVLRAS